MPWTDGGNFERGRTTSPYAFWWLQQLDPAILQRDVNDPSNLPRRRDLHLTGSQGWIAGDYTPAPAAGGAALDGQPRSTQWFDVVAQAERENGPVPLALPGDVFNAAPAAAPAWDATSPLPPAGSVIAAVIDDAIGFANQRFIKNSAAPATRFDYVWLQGAPTPGNPAPPTDLPFGRELDAPQINTLMQMFTRGGLVDEAALYRWLGYIDFRSSNVQSAASAASHGTAVMDRAGGHTDPDSDFARLVTLMGVSLPSQIIGDTSGTFIEYFLILAIERIRRRVRWLEERAGHAYPLIINMSFSLTAGAIHRRGLLDTYLDYAIADHYAGGLGFSPAPLHFVGPAGNHRLARTHAVIDLSNGAHPRLNWRILPDDRTPSFIELWSHQQAARPPAPTIHCHLGPPDVTGPLPPNPSVAFGQYSYLYIGGRPYAWAHYAWSPLDPANPAGAGHERIVVAVYPTATDWPAQVIGPSGDWEVTVVGAPIGVDLRIQRDDSLAGYRQRGRQSYFVDDQYQEYDIAGRTIANDNGAGPVTRRDTVNQLLTENAPRVIVVSANARLGEWPRPPVAGPAARGVFEMLYSGLKTPPLPKFFTPEFADATLVHRGAVTTGTLSGSAAALSGSSLAAPWATRSLADSLTGGPPWPPQIVFPAVIDRLGRRPRTYL